MTTGGKGKQQLEQRENSTKRKQEKKFKILQMHQFCAIIEHEATTSVCRIPEFENHSFDDGMYETRPGVVATLATVVK